MRLIMNPSPVVLPFDRGEADRSGAARELFLLMEPCLAE
jgi:hypothetical protein